MSESAAETNPSLPPAKPPASGKGGAGAPPSQPMDIKPVSIVDEMKRSYLDYAMSVIVSRALPDVRDGLKPVHRRILYAMKEGGYDSTKSYKKSARVVGDVMGKYHPHGDSAIYEAMVRMAQDFSMRQMLVDGQGNFGSMDGDPPAAMRYTEARLHKAAEELLRDIDKETVAFQANYDESSFEPVVLPARYPNLLVNGAGGIAVGMATNIPTHNLREVIAGTLAYLDNPDITIEELMEYIPGPDFPTGGLILGKAGIHSAYRTGHGSVIMRARTNVEPMGKDREAIIVTEIPYQVNKSRLVERIAEVVNAKIVEGISDLRDESDRTGVRVVIELKKGTFAEVILAQLYKHTPLQTSFGVNMLALDGGQPRVMNLKDMIVPFCKFREEVVVKRTQYELKKAQEKAHTLVGLALSVANIDAVIALIREAPDGATARERLMAKPWPAEAIAPMVRLVNDPDYPLIGEEGSYVYQLSKEQAQGILDLRLHRLTGLEQEKIGQDLQEITLQIKDYLDILSNRPRRIQIIRDELTEVSNAFGDDRRTTLEESEFESDIEALIQREDMVVTISTSGYIKRVPFDTYRAQRRGGKGRVGMTMKEEDAVSDLFIANTHEPLLLFTTRGIVHRLKTYQLPLGSPQSRGKALVNILPLQKDETVSAVLRLPEDEKTWGDLDIIFATSHGTVRRNRMTDFQNIRSNGLIAMKLDDNENLISVRTAPVDTGNVFLATRLGRCIRFDIGDVRVFSGRTSTGVRGIKLVEGDEVVSMSILKSIEATTEERDAYLKRKRLETGDSNSDGGEVVLVGEPAISSDKAVTLSDERYAELEAAEQYLLTVSENGMGKQSSTHEYRVTGRGGVGIRNLDMTDKTGAVVGSFLITAQHEVMLVTDQGQTIRILTKDIRTAGRVTQGVYLFRIASGERVVSVGAVLNAGNTDVAEDLENASEEDSEISAEEASIEAVAVDTVV